MKRKRHDPDQGIHNLLEAADATLTAGANIDDMCHGLNNLAATDRAQEAAPLESRAKRIRAIKR